MFQNNLKNPLFHKYSLAYYYNFFIYYLICQEEKLNDGENFDRIVFHKFTHFKEEKGWTTPEAES